MLSRRRYASGGRTATVERVTVQRGSFVVSPEAVRAAGNGSLQAGEKVLDKFVQRVRAEKQTNSEIAATAEVMRNGTRNHNHTGGLLHRPKRLRL